MSWSRRTPNRFSPQLNARIHAWATKRALPRKIAIQALLAIATERVCSGCGGDEFDPCTCVLEPVSPGSVAA